MSALWILPSIALVGGAIVLWWVGRDITLEVASLQRELAQFDDVRAELTRLRAEAAEVGAGYRGLSRR